MIKINFETIDERLNELKRSKSEIRYVVGKTALTTTVKKGLSEDDKTIIVSREINNSIVQRVKEENKSDLEKQLLIEEDALRVERNKLSTAIARMVESGATQKDLAAHYNKIESYRPGLIALYDKRQYVKQYGCLPAAPEPEKENLDPYYLKDQKKRLVDKRCKTRAKIDGILKPSLSPNTAPTPLTDKQQSKLIQWQLELDQADAEYTRIVDQLNELNG